MLHVQQREIQSHNFTKIYKPPHELGGTPFDQRAWSAPGPQSIRGHPELPQIILRNKNNLQFHQRLRNAKTTWAREKPLPTTGAERRPVREPFKSVPSLTKQTLQDTTQVNLSKQEKHYKLAQQIAFYEQKTSPRLIRSLGEGMSFNGVTMAQSPGDGSSRGLCLLQITTQEVLSLGKLSRLEHLRRWGLCHLLWPSCAQGATWSRAMVVLLDGSGGTTFAQLELLELL